MHRRTSTHSIDTDQRRIALTPTTVAGTTYLLSALPSNPGILLAGPWLLFAVNAAGVPSHATKVFIS